MKRLRDTEGDEPLFQRGVEMLRSTPPTPEAPDVRAGVWRSINPGTPEGFRTSRGGVRVLKLAMVAIVALAAGTAGAVIGHRWIVPRLDRAAAPPSTHPRPPAEKARPIPSVLPTEEIAAEIPSAKPRARSTPRKVTIVPPASAAAVARERTEVLDALVALRREHDPIRAGTLLARYLSAHPRGALREEALALAIEAADARGDRTGAAQLAQLYQEEFPAGRFLIFARSHTADRASH